jgi:heme exporter protein A
LVRALIHKPKLILLDEPFVGLDFPGREALVKLLRFALSEGSSVVYTAPAGSEGRVMEEERVIRLG